MSCVAAPSGLDDRPSAPIASRCLLPSGRKNAHRGLAACRRPASAQLCSQAPIASGKNRSSPTTARRSHLLQQSAAPTGSQAVTATAVAIPITYTLPEAVVTATPTLASVIANVVLLPIGLFYPTPTAADDMCPCGMHAEQKPPSKSRQSKPKDAPPGTIPIDQSGLSKDEIHQIKGEIGAGPADWVGITPDGHVVTTGPDGTTEDHGPQ